MSKTRNKLRIAKRRAQPTVENAVDFAAEQAGVPFKARVAATSLYKPGNYPKKAELPIPIPIPIPIPRPVLKPAKEDKTKQTGAGEIVISQNFINPNNGEIYSILEKDGQNILKEYLNFYFNL